MNIIKHSIDEQTAFNNAWNGIHQQGKLGTASFLVDKNGCFCSLGASLTQEERDYYSMGRWNDNAIAKWGSRGTLQGTDISSQWDEYYKSVDAMYDKFANVSFRERLYGIHDDVALGIGKDGMPIEGDKMALWEERMRALAAEYNLTVPE